MTAFLNTPTKWTIHILFTFYVMCSFAVCGHENKHSETVTHSIIEIKYNDSKTGDLVVSSAEYGHYGTKSRIDGESGVLVHVQSVCKQPQGCGPGWAGCAPIEPNIVPHEKWIALIRRGNCSFNKKIHFATKVSNASAVVFYNNQSKTESVYIPQTQGSYNVDNTISVFVDLDKGKNLADILDANGEVFMTIKVGQTTTSPTTTATNGQFTANNTSVLFVSISFIVLIIISLAWLVFYYIQRCRYTNAKERLSRRLANAAKKAIAKIPQRSVKFGDKELESESDQCAVCIEPYKLSDVIRVLPCRHVFHKSCVDPWLLEQRSCPMCKMDILRAFGMHLNGSQESVPQDPESGLIPSSPALEEEHLSTSEEQGAMGGVKIVLYQHPSVHYLEGSRRFSSDPELSSEEGLGCGTSGVTECHVECSNGVILHDDGLSEEPSLAMSRSRSLSRSKSLSMESIHSNDSESECNERQSLMAGMEKTESSTDIGSKSRRRSSESSSLNHSSHDISDLSEH